MRKILLLSLVLFSFLQSAKAQRLDYDHTSKWFLGLNAGATWSCTDVKNQTNAGWGLTLGKSYNWNYGNRISFDIRGRFLHGNWYGQDLDTTDLTNYQGTILNYYQDSGNMVVNNFNTEVNRLAIELVLHANRFAERTGWDPYIFGGFGVTWKQSYGDLRSDTAYYDYPTLLANGNLSNAITSTLDGVYESKLENTSTAKWMPSLGIGLAYNVGSKFAIGLEHKTTFTGSDQFDGFSSLTNRQRNDWYHYTSAFLQFRFNKHEKRPVEETVNSNNNINNFTTNCIVPTLGIKEKTIVTNQATYLLIAGSTQLSSQSQVKLKDRLGNVIPCQLNTNNHQISATLPLTPGINTFTLFGQNDCGSVSETIEITYNDCKSPIIQLTSPSNNSTQTTRQSIFNLSALVENSSNNDISVWLNGTRISNFSYNATNHVLQAILNLIPGKNTLKIEASNPCGSVYSTAEIIYDNCTTPQLQLVNPSNSGTTVSVAAQKIKINTLGFFTRNDFNILLNGQTLNSFLWVNDVLEIPVTLVNGNNTLTVNGTNRCGSESVVVSITYQQCQAPVITLQNPNVNSLTVTKAYYSLKFKTQYQSNLSLSVNNKIISSYTYNASTGIVDYGFNLSPGANIITLTSSNNCGVDIETVNLFYDNCISPTVTINSLTETVTNASYVFSANCTQVGNAQGIQLKQNGNTIPFTFLNGSITAITTLNPGINAFEIIVTNACGTQTKTLSVNYNNCIAPQISLMQPVASGITVNQSTYAIQSSLSNVNNSSEITLKVNGAVKPFQFNNGLLTASVALSPGLNNFSISVANNCGKDVENFDITFKQCLVPSIIPTNPVQLNSSTNQAALTISAQVLNCQNASEIKLFQNDLSIPFAFNNGNLTANVTLVAGNNRFQISANNNCGRDLSNLVVFYDACIAPVITLTSPNPFPTNVQSGVLNLTANIQNIASSNQLSLLVNGIGSPFTFVNGTLTAALALQNGSNSLSLSATNTCGSDVKSTVVNFIPCKAPTVVIQNPTTAGSTVAVANFNFKAMLANVTNANEVSLTLNGNPITNFSLLNGLLSANVTLTNGTNTFLIHVNNGCGVDQKATTLNLSTCNSPMVSILSANGQTVTSAGFSFNANIQNVNSAQGISLLVNGQITQVTFANNNVSANCNLQNGLNTLMLSATNACGTDTKSIQVTFQNCTVPNLAITNPNNTTQITPNFILNATVQNLSAPQVNLTLNGMPVNNFTLVGTTLTAVLSLQPGANNIALAGQNACGVDQTDLRVTYQNCISPSIAIQNLNETVSQGIYPFTATISNMPTIQGISLTLNDLPIQNFSYSNGVLFANLSLANGSNSVKVTVTNPCGTQTKTAQITYDHCQVPVITVSSPTNASDGNYVYSASIAHLDNTEGISFSFNGTNVNYELNNGILTANVTLQPGSNAFVLSVMNNCGSDIENTNVSFSNCNAPDVQISGSVPSGGTTESPSVLITVNIGGFDANTTLQVTKNGNIVNGINANNGFISQNVNLSEGLTTLIVTATNTCGTDSKTYTITRCKAPTIVLVNPNVASLNVTSATFVISLDLQNVNNTNQISLSQNGTSLTGMTLAGSSMNLPVILQAGPNNFQVNVNTGCGRDQESFVINYVANNQNPNNNGGSIPPNNQGQGFGNNANQGDGQPNNSGGKAPSNTDGKNNPTPAKPAPVTPTPAPAKPAPAPVNPAPAKPTPAKPAPALAKPTPATAPTVDPKKPAEIVPSPVVPQPGQEPPAKESNKVKGGGK
ncbi:MAG: hypothetical protein EBR91_00840 [Flavobacteriia bacterium]|nr:hypothetical protein [Flavobacteriia bacterium]